MSWKGVRLPVVAGVFLVVLAVALVGSRVYMQQNLVRPLERQLERVAGVEQVQVVPGSPWSVDIQLGPGLNLPLTYAKIQHVVGSYLGGRVFQIHLQPAADSTLLVTYQQMQLWIQEALATGRFSQLPQALARVAQQKGAQDLGVWVDGQAVYVRFQQDKHWFYAVESRRVTAASPVTGSLDATTNQTEPGGDARAEGGA
ncbi:MAG: hypothetical protein IMX01_02985 [Limnochordaceae bacterium]|nr:hypothetical protein [Limnochordaceae bacterium]